jgi:hypothetical protein
VKYPLFLSVFNITMNSMDKFSKNPQIPNFMKIHPVGKELLHWDRRTDGQIMTTLTDDFRNFANAPKE